MSKVNRRKEIKEKEAFQLKFQLALSRNNKAVLNWLPKNEGTSAAEISASDRQEFLNLPIVPAGSSLSHLEKSEEYTVGSFLQTEGPPAKRTQHENRTGSKAMTALMNKMRGESRRKEPVKKPQRRMIDEVKKKKKVIELAEPDSDEEESKSAQITRKQTKVLKGRPF